MNAPSLPRRFLIALGLFLLAACGTTEPRGGPPAVAVAVVPSTASLLTSGSQDFTARVTNDPSNSGATWSITGCGGGASVCGSLSNVTSATVTYTAPATVPPGAIGVTATAVADPTKSFTASSYVSSRLFVALATSNNHTCGLTSSGAAYCWGSGPLGNGSTTNSSIPVAVSGGLSLSALAAGGGHTCGRIASGAAYCWGDNATGQLGNGSWDDAGIPTPVSGGLSFIALATSNNHTCGLTSSGAAYCWGNDIFGQLGSSPVDGNSSLTPQAVSGNLNFSGLATGVFHTCGRTSSGTAYCWGDNENGQLGSGSTIFNSVTPVAVSGGLSFSALGAGEQHTCGLTSSGAAYCWGSNFFHGQLGTGSNTDSSIPVAVSGGLSFSALATSANHTCGLTSSGAAYCWGDNAFGQLGNGSTTGPELCNNQPCSTTPVAVFGGLTFSALAAGGRHTCGLASTGAAYCWGDNSFGQLGNGSTMSSSVPVAVVGWP